MPPQELPHEPPVGGSQSPLVDPQRQRTSRYAPYHRGDRTLSQRHRPGPLEQLPGNAYPRLLPRPTTDMSVATAPYNREVLAQITASLRESIPSIDPLTPAYEVNLSFIALCNTNLIHLTDDTVRREVEMRLLAASGKELVELARAVQLGIRDLLSKGGGPHQPGQSHSGSAASGDADSLVSGGTPRSKTQILTALQRDDHTCIITGENFGLNEVAHIFPYSLGSSPTSSHNGFSSHKPNFSKFLELFAGSTVALHLENYLLSLQQSRNGNWWTQINRLENLITLSPTVHRMFDRCYFTLVPIGDPLAALEQPGVGLMEYSCRFQWMPRRNYGDGVDLSRVSEQGTQLGEDEDKEVSGFVFDKRVNQRVVSGHVVHLRTSDPKRYPLPHPDLLRLHAAIAGVVRCSGASMEQEDYDYWDEPEEEQATAEGTNEENIHSDVETGVDDQEESPQWVLQRTLSGREKIKSWALKRWIQGASSDLDMDNDTPQKKEALEIPPRRPATQGRTRTSPYPVPTKPQKFAVARRGRNRGCAASEPTLP